MKRKRADDFFSVLRFTFHFSRFTTVAVPGFVPIHSGETARALLPLPLLEGSFPEHNRRGVEKLSRSRRLCRHFPTHHEKNQMLVSVHPAMVLSHRSIEFHFIEKEYDRGIYV